MTDTDWDFEVADWNGDGAQDLFAIKHHGLSNHTEVHVLDGATSLSTYLGHYTTVFGQTDANWEFDVGDCNHDGTPDLLGVRRAGGTSGNVEVDILNGADDFSTVLQHSVTAISQTETQLDFNLVDWNRDSTLDLVVTKRNGTSNSTEVHVLSGATGFSEFLLHAGTALHQADGTWVFKLARRDETFLERLLDGGNGFDLVGIKRSGTANGPLPARKTNRKIPR
ncbi:Integrin-like repeats domain fused to lysozyme, LYCV glycosyl hydrolase [Cystobacter fuscus DSM 2262]|uniref:Integrin-like repeats domain fused to lysozyme, LYCV glycosyl hydrolase n=1 Tax=Cystobacter fuscus (strain ATCC 25194 / DSM 2262 / NBRC 100088 / M29) TaxID=1242864 RepID=S9R1M5_CYSF2|nr:FG-GAP-like repeat-containing protein [Cystobacter fuscus]EPX62793.1 Integrin-like repeats domain fused to lysozyme, LYCV glycosyl hydrolase [Cystobacter fuscus DSM 2262]